MPVRGIRGATTVRLDQSIEILAATRELLIAIQQANPLLQAEDLASVIFTVSSDLHAAYPAEAARQLGWVNVPMLCSSEISVPGELPGCVRILLHWNTDLPQHAIHHVYLKEAVRLRPDLVKSENQNPDR